MERCYIGRNTGITSRLANDAGHLIDVQEMRGGWVTDFWSDAEVISVYTREQAIEDGVLVDITDTAREVGFVVPVAIIRATWASLVEWNTANGVHQDEADRLWDVVSMAMFGMRQTREGQCAPITIEMVRVPNRPDNTMLEDAKFVLHSGPVTTVSMSSPSCFLGRIDATYVCR